MSYRYITQQATQEQMQREFLRKQAILNSGYAFIVLELKQRTKRRVSGIDELKPVYGENNEISYEVVSRQLQFEPDISRGGIDTAHVLYTEYNKKFLASHLDGNYWKIVNTISSSDGDPITRESVLRDLRAIRDSMVSETVKNPPKPINDSGPFDVESLSEDVLERELERRKKLKEKIDTSVSEEELKKLSPAQKAKVTKAKNKAKKQQEEMSRLIEDTEVLSKESIFVQPGAGVAQP